MADGYRAELVRAARKGLAFAPGTGEPESWAAPGPEPVTWYRHAVAYAEMKWPHLAPHSRASVADALAGDGLRHRVVGQELHLDRGLGQRAGHDRTYGLAFTGPVPSDACHTLLPPTGSSGLPWRWHLRPQVHAARGPSS